MMTEQAVQSLIESLGLDVNDEHLQDTPRRIASFYRTFLMEGQENFRFTTFVADSDEMVVTANISFYSICSHHFVPFFGAGHIAYLPGDKLAGLSKLARSLRMFASRPQVQERLTRQVAEYLMEKLEPKGVAVVLQAEHLCMSMRGVKSPGHQTVTEKALGEMDIERNLKKFYRQLSLVMED
jgi:GTP cyclohydrolase I